MDKKQIISVIFARGGSKGIPKKNIKQLAGKPLIAHSIEKALNCKMIDRVFVSTDCEEIAAVAKKFGAEVPFMRPDKLAGDKSAEWKAWQHSIVEIQKMGISIDVFITLPPTSPLRNQNDIEKCINIFLENKVDIVVTGCESHRSPYFNMVSKDKNGFVQKVINQGNVFRRQDAPVVYDLTTVAYVADPNFILKSDNMFSGKMMISEVPQIRCLDIDTEVDFFIAEKLFNDVGFLDK